MNSHSDHVNTHTVDQMERRIMERMDEILDQVRTTNGRVTKLELRDAWTRGVLAALTGMLGLPAVVGSILGVLYAVRNF